MILLLIKSFNGLNKKGGDKRGHLRIGADAPYTSALTRLTHSSTYLIGTQPQHLCSRSAFWPPDTQLYP
jgi:hypothetical protein